MALLIGAVAVLLVPTSSEPARAAGDGDSSAVTVQGTGRFADLSVTVSQTEHLINQVVDITWTGGEQTAPVTGNFNADYLQIMQCWGDGAVPKRENCQFGGLLDTRGGFWSSTRQVSYGSTLVDPAETYLPPAGTNQQAYVPFAPVRGAATTGAENPYFDAYSTNEIPYARTHADGTGEEHFEVQTAREAPGLGCGQRLDRGGVRDCWLVIVPRDDLEVDGLPMRQRLESSPLSATNWANHLDVRLGFDPIGLSCPIGTPERRLVGQEEVADAISRWQPVLCGETGSIFGFSQISDEIGRSQALAEDPWMSFISEPLAPDRDPDEALVYAPAAVSGIGIAFNIDRVAAYDAPEEVNARSGTRIESINLTPRLVAKLLTQSYRAASLAPAKLGDNPLGLGSDPDFIAINPEFADLQIRGLASVTVPAGQSDAYAELWRWVESDDRARVFLDGEPDPWGMKVNPAYLDMSLDRSDFPISDLDCRTFGDGTPDLCPLDYLAYAQDLHDAGRAAARGSTLSRGNYSIDAGGGWRLTAPQLSGNHAVLALVDTATAARYSLPVAALQTGRDTFVAPDQDSLAAGLAAMGPSEIDGVLSSNPSPDSDEAYPLTHIAYAVTAPDRLTKDERTAYSKFLRYIATDGQEPGIEQGELPPGYLPLTDELREQALAAAALVAPSAPTDSSTPTPTDSPTPTTDEPSDSSTPSTTPGPDGVVPVPTPPTASTSPSPSASTSPAPIATVSYPTPPSPVGPQRFLMAGLLVATAGLLVARPFVSRLGSRRAT
jgi:hypothetical protein